MDYKKREIAQYLRFYEVMKEFLEVYSIENIGYSCTINPDAVAEYMSSDKFLVRFKFGDLDKEAILMEMEEDVLTGKRVWELLNLTPWQRNMMESNFKVEVAEQKAEIEKKYKCPTCQFLNIKTTSFGSIAYCTYKKCDRSRGSSRGESLESYKVRCKYYEERSD